MSTFRLLSLLVIPHIFLRTAISKVFSFRFWSSKSPSYIEQLTGPLTDIEELLLTCWYPLLSECCVDFLRCQQPDQFFCLHPCVISSYCYICSYKSVLSVTVCVGEWSGKCRSCVIFILRRPLASSFVIGWWRSRVGRWLQQSSHSAAQQRTATATRPDWQHKHSSQAVVAKGIVLRWTHVTTIRSAQQQQWGVVAALRRLAVQCSLSEWLIAATGPLAVTICVCCEPASTHHFHFWPFNIIVLTLQHLFCVIVA